MKWFPFALLMTVLMNAGFVAPAAYAESPAAQTQPSEPKATQAHTTSRLEITPVADTPLLTGADLKTAQVTGSGDQSLLLVELKSEAAARVRVYTAEHVEGRLALLLDGQPVMLPRIRVPLGDRFQVGPLPKAQAERLAALINGG